MNKSAKWVIGIGVLLFMLSALYPPWVFIDRPGAGSFSENNAGYSILFNPPENNDNREHHGVRLDLKRLGVEWACIVAIAGTALFFMRQG